MLRQHATMLAMNDMTIPCSSPKETLMEWGSRTGRERRIEEIAVTLYAAMIAHHGAYLAEQASMSRLAVEHAKRLLLEIEAS